MSSPYINLPKTPYIEKDSYNKDTGTYIDNSGLGYSVAPEKVEALKQQVNKTIVVSGSGAKTGRSKSRSKKKENKTESSIPEITNMPVSSEKVQENKSMPPSQEKKPLTPSSKKQVNKEAYLLSQQNQVPRGTREIPIQPDKRTVFFEPSRAGTITINEPTSKEEELNRGFSRARQEFLDEVAFSQNQVYIQGEEQKKNFTGKGLKTAGTVIALGGVSAGVGAVKGVSGAVKDVATLQIIPKTFDTLTEVATNPKGVYRELKTDFTKNPVSFVAEQGAYAVTLNKIPVFTKKVYKGSVSYVNRYEVAGSKANPLENIPTTGKEFFIGDVDYGKNIQVTIGGGTANPSLLPKKSPLGLEETPFYKTPPSQQKTNLIISPEGELKAKSSLVESPLVLDDNIRVPEIRYPVEGEVSVDYGQFKIKQKVRDEKVFGETFVGERTRTDFFPSPEKIESVTPEFVEQPISSGWKKIELDKNKKIVNAEYVEVQKQPLSFKEKPGKQKELNFDELDNFIGSNIGLFSETIKIGKSIYGEFKPGTRIKSPSREYPSIIRAEPKRVVPFANLNPYESLTKEQNLVSSFEDTRTNPVTDNVFETSISPENIQDSVQSPKVDTFYGVSSRTRTRTKTDYKIDTKQETIQQPDSIIEPKRVTEKIAQRPVMMSISRPVRAPPFVPIPKIKVDSPVQRVQGFDVLVKRKGKFERINTGALSREEAINFGSYRVGRTASASFKITPSNLKSKQVFRSKGKLSDFVQKKGVFIERKEKRIKSLGELQEITFKGLSTRRNKNFWSKLR
ncbi:MAG: hypothetical protein ACP5N3_04205 [Candidatus Nanoarchaeia archaeon]